MHIKLIDTQSILVENDIAHSPSTWHEGVPGLEKKAQNGSILDVNCAVKSISKSKIKMREVLCFRHKLLSICIKFVYIKQYHVILQVSEIFFERDQK